MSLIPAFQIGVWNAWIPMIYPFIITFLVMAINKSAKEEGDLTTKYSKTEKNILISFHVIIFLLLIYAIFLPFELGTLWFYVGLPIALLGLIAYTMVMVSFATTRLADEPMTTGVYRYSRHPMYLSMAVAFIGVGIACASWIFLLFSVAYTILSLMSAFPEERFLLEKYGDAYHEYMNRTPRWIGMPKTSEK